MVTTVKPKAMETPSKPMPTSGKAAARTALPPSLEPAYSLVKSITYNNGSENVLHQDINEKLGSAPIFARHTIAGRKALLSRLMV